MFMEPDVDMVEAARMEEELMREAELEHLQMEAEWAMAQTAASEDFDPSLEQAEPEGEPVEPVTSTAAITMRIACAPNGSVGGLALPLSCAPNGSVGGSALLSSSSGCGACVPLASVAAVVAAAPETPPVRSNLTRARSITPERRRREPVPGKLAEHDVSSVCLPIAASSVVEDVGPSSGGLSPPPSSLGPHPEGVRLPPVSEASRSRKRRRIRGKGGDVSTAPSEASSAGVSATAEVVTAAELAEVLLFAKIAWPAEDEWKNLTPRVQRNFVYDAMRTAWCKMKANELKLSAGPATLCHSGGWKNVWKDARAIFGSLSTKYRQELQQKLMVALKAPAHVKETFDRMAAWQDYGGKKMQSAMYTWISTSWILPRAASKAGSLDVAISVAKRIGWVEQLRQELRTLIAGVMEEWHSMDWASAMEICTRTFFEQGVAQLHFHVLLRHSEKAVWMPSPDRMKLGNVSPHISAAPHVGKSRVTLHKSWAGFFYCSVPKYGQVHVGSSKEAFRDYPVQGQWVMSLLQAGKVTAADARQLIFRVAHGVTRLLADLDVVERELEVTRVRAAQQAVQEALAPRLHSWRSLPPVEAWDASYAELKERYEFLVLDGPSRMGKTAFARSKCPAGQRILEINCAAGGEPDLRPYKHGHHGLILCDEIEAEAVAAQRKLFQAGTAFVQLGTSPTNIHVYMVFVHRVRIVCASNNWLASLARLTEDDRAWIEKNSIYVRCDAPLWEEP